MNTYPPLDGGFMPDYACSAKCRHCMYGCSYIGSRDYVSEKDADRIMQTLRSYDVRYLHIGGGEPFLNFEGLKYVIRAMRRYGIGIDYIETNAFWCTDLEEAKRKLSIIRDLGADTIMASCDPFHIEYVPLQRVATFVRACREVGIDYFVWKDQFFRRLSKLDMTKTHKEDELRALLGEDYIRDTAREYGIGMNGRALQIARTIYPSKPGKELLDDTPCMKLLRGRHCHVDLYGNVIPAGCTGIAIPLEDYFEHRQSLYDPEKYPVLSALLTGGLAALYSYAVEKGFPEDTKAATKCDLCYQLRRYLHENAPVREVGPDCYYEMMES